MWGLGELHIVVTYDLNQISPWIAEIEKAANAPAGCWFRVDSDGFGGERGALIVIGSVVTSLIALV